MRDCITPEPVHGGAGMSGRTPTKNEGETWLRECIPVRICARIGGLHRDGRRRADSGAR